MKYIYSDGQAEIDLSTATRDELLEAQDRISDFRGLIKGKIEAVNTERILTGIYADPRDYARWKGIMRQHGGQLRKINNALSRHATERKKEHQVQEGTFLQCFVDSARLMLHKDDFAVIAIAAQAMAESRKLKGEVTK